MSPTRTSPGAVPLDMEDLAEMTAGRTLQEVTALVEGLPGPVVHALVASTTGATTTTAPTPLALAAAIEGSAYRIRDHLRLVSDTLTAAVADVETGQSRRIAIEMPPRTGKTRLTTQYTPLWLLGRHPDWNMALVSHDPTLASSWGRQIRRWVEEGQLPGVSIAPDAGAVSEWETGAGGVVLSRSIRGSFIGRGARVLFIDDPHKDAVEAHSEDARERVWSWWLSVAQTRLEPNSLVAVVMTRWHEDDLIGRLLSTDHEGDPGDWQVIRLPALADDPADALGRAEGEPLLSPLTDETPEQAVARWDQVRTDVGSYTWSALYQQRPSPAKGAIFDTGWWRYWTRDPGKVTDDGRVVLLEPEGVVGGRWIDSWDCAFKGTDTSDFVVGQRWLRHVANRYLIAQQRGRWTFTQTLERMKAWSTGGGPAGHLVHERLVEDKANGTAVIDVLRETVAGMIPINPTNSKESRARSITPEVESGHVFLPHPTDPGNGWVSDLLSELREFNSGAHDDQVDALTQALSRLRDAGHASITVPGRGRGQASPAARRAPRPGLAGQAARAERSRESSTRPHSYRR